MCWPVHGCDRSAFAAMVNNLSKHKVYSMDRSEGNYVHVRVVGQIISIHTKSYKVIQDHSESMDLFFSKQQPKFYLFILVIYYDDRQ